ncbi:MAG: hypothetical protein ABI867_36180 [Kofleriaceae bacterium]
MPKWIALVIAMVAGRAEAQVCNHACPMADLRDGPAGDRGSGSHARRARVPRRARRVRQGGVEFAMFDKAGTPDAKARAAELRASP